MIILSVLGHPVSVSTAQLCNCSLKGASDNMQMKDVIVANKTLFIKTSQGPIYLLTPSVRLLQKPIWKNMKFIYEARIGRKWDKC